MDTAKDTPAEQHRMEKEDIEDLGTVTLTRGHLPQGDGNPLSHRCAMPDSPFCHLR